MWRQINKKLDPVKKDTGFFLELEVQGMAAMRVSHFEETYAYLQNLESKPLNFQSVTGKPVDDHIVCKTLWAIMDDDTADKLDKLDEDREEEDDKTYKDDL